jgi:DNA gyrase inhibitor GyrI
MKILMIAVAVVISIVLANAGRAASRGGYESAPYQVTRSDGEFELRDYPSLIIAETPLRGSDDAFMRLFRYLDGQNADARKIPMTTPVFMTSASTNATMAFVMPATMTTTNTPQPRNRDVAISTIVGGRFAVLRFGGRRTRANESKAHAALVERMKQENLTPVGEPIFAYFDPPWTPVFLRRNEVMLRIQP